MSIIAIKANIARRFSQSNPINQNKPIARRRGDAEKIKAKNWAALRAENRKDLMVLTGEAGTNYGVLCDSAPPRDA